MDNKSCIVNDKKNISKVPIIKSLQKFNTKGNAFKNIFSQYNLNNLNLNNKKVSLEKNNSKRTLSKIQTQSKDIKTKYSHNSGIKTNNNAINAIKSKANIIITNNNNNNKINNNNSIKIKKKNNYLDNIRITQTITANNNIPNLHTNNFKLLPKRAIHVVKKPPTKKVKSRNYISIKDINTINIDARIHINEYNPNYYFTTNDKNVNILSKKIQTTQNSKKKNAINILKTEKKNNVINKVNNIQNKKLFSHLNTVKYIPNYTENSERNKNKTSLSPSLKNLIIKAKNVNSYGKNIITNTTKNNKNSYVNSYMPTDSQRLVKNLKIGNSG
jgi:hypothetical protein